MFLYWRPDDRSIFEGVSGVMCEEVDFPNYCLGVKH